VRPSDRGLLDVALTWFGYGWAGLLSACYVGSLIWLDFNDPIFGKLIIKVGDEPTLLGKWLVPGSISETVILFVGALPAIVAFAWRDRLRKQRRVR
jgi:hypothetical protein